MVISLLFLCRWEFFRLNRVLLNRCLLVSDLDLDFRILYYWILTCMHICFIHVISNLIHLFDHLYKTYLTIYQTVYSCPRLHTYT